MTLALSDELLQLAAETIDPYHVGDVPRGVGENQDERDGQEDHGAGVHLFSLLSATMRSA